MDAISSGRRALVLHLRDQLPRPHLAQLRWRWQLPERGAEAVRAGAVDLGFPW